MKRVSKILASFFITLVSIAVSPVFAQYPERPVKFIVPWPPGESDEIVVRMIAEELSKESGQPVTVVNKPGGGGVIGTSEVARSRPDGLTIGLLVNDLLTFKILSNSVPWDFDTFEPVGIFFDTPFVIAASGNAAYSTMEELAEYSKSHDVSLGHYGYQASPTAATLQAAKAIGIKFSSDAPFDMIDCATLANGDADVVNTTTQFILACLKTGDVKILASLTRERLSLSPDVPTLEEITGAPHTTWSGLFVPKGTPQEAKDKIAEVAAKVIKNDRVKELANSTGGYFFWQDASESKVRIEKEIKDSQQLLEYLR